MKTQYAPIAVHPDELDSREVYAADGELEGYVLHERRSDKALTPVECCRTCAWSHLDKIKYVPGVGIRYLG